MSEKNNNYTLSEHNANGASQQLPLVILSCCYGVSKVFKVVFSTLQCCYWGDAHFSVPHAKILRQLLKVIDPL